MTSQEMHIAFKTLVDKIDAKVYSNILPEEINYFLNKAQLRIIKDRFSGHNIYRESFEQTQKRITDLKNIVTADITLTQSSNQDGVSDNAIFFDLPTDYYLSVRETGNINYTDCNGNVISGKIKFYDTSEGEVNYDVEDPFNKPSGQDETGLRLIIGNKIEAFTDGDFVITNYKLRYIRKPKDIIYKKYITGGIPSGKLIAGSEYIVEGSNTSVITHNGTNYGYQDTFVANNPNFSTISGSPEVQLLNKNCELSEFIHDEIVDEAVNIALEVIESPRFQTNSIKNKEKE